MNVEELDILGAFLLKPELIRDERGFFFRAFCKEELAKNGVIVDEIVQVNRSFNIAKGTFRGLHYQNPPYAEEKIVACLNGSIADVIVDLRKSSPSFLSHEIVELSPENQIAVLIPKGCAHGFITLVENTELLYMHTNSYAPQSESACSIYDPLLNIKLPIAIKEISERDRIHSFLDKDFKGIRI